MCVPYNSHRIALVGVKHSGKSTVGRELALSLSLPFIDGDDLIVQMAHELYPDIIAQTSTARDVYRVIGMREFKAIEAQSTQRLPDRYVFAAGGGISECKDVWDALHDACIVFLRVSVIIAWERITNTSPSNIPPSDTIPAFIADAENPFESFSALFKERSAIYTAHAHIICDTNDVDPKTTVLFLLQHLKQSIT